MWQKGLEASPKNRHVWQAWALFEAKQGNNERARQLFHRGYELNTRDPVLLQAFALFEYHCSHSGIARDLFKRAIAVDPNHQPVWIVCLASIAMHSC
jgi:Tfp pilus assembly protein PilF